MAKHRRGVGDVSMGKSRVNAHFRFFVIYQQVRKWAFCLNDAFRVRVTYYADFVCRFCRFADLCRFADFARDGGIVHLAANTKNAVSRSNFVTVLAWIFIALSGIGLFISLLQNVMINFYFPLEEIQQRVHHPEAKEQIPPLFIFLARSIRQIFLAVLILTILMLTSSIGLLKRRNWARIVFIILMSIGILWNIGAVFLQQFILPSFQKLPAEAHDQMPQFEAMLNVMKIVTAMMAIGFSVLFGWIIKKLVSLEVREEFQSQCCN